MQVPRSCMDFPWFSYLFLLVPETGFCATQIRHHLVNGFLVILVPRTSNSMGSIIETTIHELHIIPTFQHSKQIKFLWSKNICKKFNFKRLEAWTLAPRCQMSTKSMGLITNLGTSNRSPFKIVSYDLAIFSPPLQSNVDENDVLASNLSTEFLAKTIMRYISTMNLWKDFLALTGCCCFCCCCWHGGPSKKLFQRQSVVSCLALRKGVHDISWTFFAIPEFNGFTVHGFTGLLVYSRSGAATFSTLKSQFAPHFLERTQPERWDSEFHRSYSTPPTSQGHWNDHLAHGGWNSSYIEFNS